ncbi:hypothetical protein BKA70DRAFT_1149252 [Coprinopsis sp. MPI-PUGE-AT-0042]|nr:hypothetical protein BKA70DRAFT_1149252 [Coprinopsis sp. MPI-PUGE-AT-0042]
MAFPASSQLPDEIIKEILAPALYVPDETFADTVLKASPFATYGLSSSTILVVCKSWLRVATPLLYDTVVLRSKAQAQALAAVLKRDNQLGTFIRKLRIEGGYGNAIFETLKRSPHITDIWISTAVWSNESVAGYAKGFLLVDPRRLIVVDDRLKTSAIRERIFEALKEAVKERWSNLNTVILEIPRPELLRISGLVDALAQSPAEVERLELLGPHVKWVKLMMRPSIKSIRIITWRKKPAFSSASDTTPPGAFEIALRSDRALYDKTVYDSGVKESLFSKNARADPKPAEDARIMATPLDPNWKPLANAARQERDIIWGKILAFAMSPLSPGTRSPSQMFTWQRIRAGLARVCKEFNRIGTPLLYEVVMLPTSTAITGLTASPHKQHIKEIWLQQYESVPEGIALNTNAIADLVESCRSLVVVSQAKVWGLQDRDAGPEPMPYLWNEERPDINFPVRALASLSGHSAETLQHLNLGIDLDEDDGDSDMELSRIIEILGRFRELRSLTLCSGGDAPITRSEIGVELPRDAFSKVERVRMSNNSLLNSSLLGALVDVELPSLKHVTLRAADHGGFKLVQTVLAFFHAHGHKMSYLNSPSVAGYMFCVLLNLAEWEVTTDRSGKYNFDFLDEFPEVIYSLKTMKFTLYGLGPLAEFLYPLDLALFKGLETVQITKTLVWPTNQRDIDKSMWVKIAERALEKWNVKVLDRTGKAWVPRLKPATTSRSRKK